MLPDYAKKVCPFQVGIKAEDFTNTILRTYASNRRKRYIMGRNQINFSKMTTEALAQIETFKTFLNASIQFQFWWRLAGSNR